MPFDLAICSEACKRLKADGDIFIPLFEEIPGIELYRALDANLIIRGERCADLSAFASLS